MLALAPVTDPAAISHALAAALDLRVVQGDALSACISLLAAELLDTAADHALAAPAASVAPQSRPQQRPAVRRAQALEVARQAIEQNLSLRQASTQ